MAEQTAAKRAAFEKQRAFVATPIGAAYQRMIATLGNAWVTDCNPRSSDRKMKDDWKAAHEAQQAFRRLLEELMERDAKTAQKENIYA